MDLATISTAVTIVGIIITILALIFGSKAIIKKHVGRDDNSINIDENANIKNSFNSEKNIIKKSRK